MINKIIKKFFYTLIKVSNTRGRRVKNTGFRALKRQKRKRQEAKDKCGI